MGSGGISVSLRLGLGARTGCVLSAETDRQTRGGKQPLSISARVGPMCKLEELKAHQ